MQIMQLTKEQQKIREREVKRAERKRNMMLLKAKLFHKEIPTDDKDTIQAHSDGQGQLRDYYVANPYLQTNASFQCIVPLIEDKENNRYVYRGMMGGAKNGFGVIESNVPISKIVASPYGNEKFLEMLSEENAMEALGNYYDLIGEPREIAQGRTGYFERPTFPLGTITKAENGKFSFASDYKPDIENMLKQEREEEKRKAEALEEGTINIGGGIGLNLDPDCWLDGTKFNGVNYEGLLYKYSPGAPVKTDDGKYVHVGKLEIGKSRAEKYDKKTPIKLVQPYVCEDFVLWTEGKSLLQYFFDNKLSGLNYALANIISSAKIEMQKNKEGEVVCLGGVTRNEDGICISKEETPETVKQVAKSMIEKHKEKDNVIEAKFGDR